MMYNKILFASLPMVMGSFEARADLPLATLYFEQNVLSAITTIKEFFSTGNGILFIGFLLWILYIIVFFPNDTLKKL